MNLPPSNTEKLKFIGGAIIVLAAAAIMFPEFVQVAMGLWRIFLIIVVAGGSCLAIAHVTRHFAKLKAVKNEEKSGLPPAATIGNSITNVNPDQNHSVN